MYPPPNLKCTQTLKTNLFEYTFDWCVTTCRFSPDQQLSFQGGIPFLSTRPGFRFSARGDEPSNKTQASLMGPPSAPQSRPSPDVKGRPGQSIAASRGMYACF